MNKINTTKYIIIKLCDWYFEINPSKKTTRDNDLSILKVLKLIFLLSPIEDNNNQKLLDCGFKFEAWALGPVEVEVYNSKQLLCVNQDQRKVEYNQLFNSIDNEGVDKIFVDNVIDILKSKNKFLINLSATQLVELTHKYSSWITSYGLEGDNSMKNHLIITEEKFYFL